ncbi:MAG: hypothetical protein JW927_00815 [Deltaproteobacteria bacterium]|nr:hypothetical protein [Deltaproteobacteria bacterium]
MRLFLIYLITGLIFTGFAGCENHSSPDDKINSSVCDRTCLEEFVNKYLEAMIANDPGKAPFSKTARYTENADEMPLSSISMGLWTTAAALTDYKFYISDVDAGQVAFVGLVKTKGKDMPSLLSMRLRIENREITEAEAIVVDSLTGGVGGAMAVPPIAFSQVLPSEDRVSREELVRISDLYFDSIELSNSRIVPWHDECYRLENGMWTAGTNLPPEMATHVKETPAPQFTPTGETSIAFARGVCSEAIDSGVFALIESITPRRTPVIDVEKGVTWGVYMFNHPGVETITMPDGSTQPAAYFRGEPNSMPMSELFKIKGGKIRDIMAIGVIKKYKSGSGWD